MTEMNDFVVRLKNVEELLKWWVDVTAADGLRCDEIGCCCYIEEGLAPAMENCPTPFCYLIKDVKNDSNE